MTDKDYIILLKQLKKELHKRYGRNICKEIHSDCFDCRIRIMIGQINSEISLNDLTNK